MAELPTIYAEIRRACELAGGQAQWAAKIGVSAAYVSQLVNAHKDPSPKILSALGFVRRVIYKRSNRG